MSDTKVLVVDDNDLVLSSQIRILKQEGFSVDGASDGMEALELINQTEYDVVLSDISMPGMTGTELLRNIRREDLDVPVILITGVPALETAMEAIELGALRYLQKPVASSQLKEVVSYAAKMHRLAKLKHAALDLLGTAGQRITDRAGMEASFNKGMDAMWIAYQPLVQCNPQMLYGYEALLRTTEATIPHPGEFFRMAEQLERVHELGRAIRASVAGTIPRAADDVHLFVNLHPTDLLDEDLYSRHAPLTKMAKRVVLEITERASIDRIKDVRDRVSRLKEMGFRVAVDDLGAGYAGLTSLAHLEPEVAKLDMSLIRDIDQNNTKAELVRSLADVCGKLDMMVVAEGIETTAERDTVTEFGCDILQGFLLGKPAKPFSTYSWDG